MQFKCSINKIGTEKLAVISAINSLFSSQSQKTVVVKIDKDVLFEMKANLSDIQRTRLFVEQVPEYLPGYKAEIYKDNESNKNFMRVYKCPQAE